MRFLPFLFFFISPFFSFSQFSSSVDLVGSFDITYRTVSNSIIKEPNKDVKAKLHWRAGFNYNKSLNEKLTIKSGIRFSTLGYKTIEMELHYGDTVYNPELPSRAQFIYDYMFITVPLVLRFSNNNKRINPFFEAGFAPAIYLKTRTKQITDISTKIIHSDQTDDLYNFNRFHLTGIVSVGANYTMSHNYQLFAQPIFRYHLTKLANGFGSERLFSAGIEIGLRKGFGGTNNTFTKKQKKTINHN